MPDLRPHNDLEFVASPAILQGLNRIEREALRHELNELSKGHGNSYGLELSVDPRPQTIEDVLAAFSSQSPVPVVTDSGENTRHMQTLDKTALQKAMCIGLKHYTRLLPGLQVQTARMQVIKDTQQHPYNPGGLHAHTDSEPTWHPKPAQYHFQTMRLCIAVCDTDPGTKLCRITQPLPRGNALRALMRREVRRNKGPNPKRFMRVLRQTPQSAQILDTKGGAIGCFTGQTVHWRDMQADADAYRQRGFAVLDLYIPNNPHNRRIIRSALRPMHKKKSSQKISRNPR